MAIHDFVSPDDVIQNGRRDQEKSRGTSSVKYSRQQAFACRLGYARGLSVAFEKRWNFPSITWAHNAQHVRSSPIYTWISQITQFYFCGGR